MEGREKLLKTRITYIFINSKCGHQLMQCVLFFDDVCMLFRSSKLTMKWSTLKKKNWKKKENKILLFQCSSPFCNCFVTQETVPFLSSMLLSNICMLSVHFPLHWPGQAWDEDTDFRSRQREEWARSCLQRLEQSESQLLKSK